jgi:hypothetical protein
MMLLGVMLRNYRSVALFPQATLAFRAGIFANFAQESNRCSYGIVGNSNTFESNQKGTSFKPQYLSNCQELDEQPSAPDERVRSIEKGVRCIDKEVRCNHKGVRCIDKGGPTEGGKDVSSG